MSDELIMKWEKAKKNLAAAKTVEAQLRREVLAEVFSFNEELREGTENFELGKGYKLKAQFKISRKLVGDVELALREISERFEDGVFIAERLVRWKPELSTAEYKRLPAEVMSIIDEVIESRSSLPSLELIPPKGKK